MEHKDKRIDTLLVELGYTNSRSRAQWLIEMGYVKIDGKVVRKNSLKVSKDSEIEVFEELPYVSRAGLKIEEFWKEFPFEIKGKVICDLGSSNGGFVQFFLRNGVNRVYAVDVNTEQLDDTLKSDVRVKPIEINAKELSESILGERVDIVSSDLSFISILKVLENIKKILKDEGVAVILIKPQFETSDHKGVIRDKKIHYTVLESVINSIFQSGFEISYLTYSKILGGDGNIEFFVLLKKAIVNVVSLQKYDIIKVVDRAWEALR